MLLLIPLHFFHWWSLYLYLVQSQRIHVLSSKFTGKHTHTSQISHIFTHTKIIKDPVSAWIHLHTLPRLFKQLFQNLYLCVYIGYGFESKIWWVSTLFPKSVLEKIEHNISEAGRKVKQFVCDQIRGNRMCWESSLKHSGSYDRQIHSHKPAGNWRK